MTIDMTTTNQPSRNLGRVLRLTFVLTGCFVLAGVGLFLGRQVRGDDPRYELPAISAGQRDDLAKRVETGSGAAKKPSTETPASEATKPEGGSKPPSSPADAISVSGPGHTPLSAPVMAGGSVPAAAGLVADGIPLIPNPGGGPDLTPLNLDAPSLPPASDTQIEEAFEDAPGLSAAFNDLDRAHLSGAERLRDEKVDVFVDPCTLGVELDGCGDGFEATVLAQRVNDGRPLPAELQVLASGPVFDHDLLATACRTQTGGDRGLDVWVAFILNMPAVGTARIVFTDPDNHPAQRSFYGIDANLEPNGNQRVSWARDFDRGLVPEPFTLCARIPRNVVKASPHYGCPWGCSRTMYSFIDLESIGGHRLTLGPVRSGSLDDAKHDYFDSLATPTRIIPFGDRLLRVEAMVAVLDPVNRHPARALAAVAVPSSVDCRDYSPENNQPAAVSRQLGRTTYQGAGGATRATIELVLPAGSQPGTTYRLCIYWIGFDGPSFAPVDIRRIEQHVIVPPTFPRVTFAFGPAGNMGSGPFKLNIEGPLPGVVSRCDDPRRAGQVICELSGYEVGNYFIGDGDPADEVLASILTLSDGPVAIPADQEFRPLRVPIDRRGCRGSRIFDVPLFPRNDETVPVTVTCDTANSSYGFVGQPEPREEYIDFSDRWVIDPPDTGTTIGLVENEGRPAGLVLSIPDAPPLLDAPNVSFTPVGRETLATATEFRLDLITDRPARVVATLTPDGPAVPECPTIRFTANTNDQGHLGKAGIRPCAGTRYGARIDLTSTLNPEAGTSTFGPNPGLVFSKGPYGDQFYRGLSFSGQNQSVRWSARWRLRPPADLLPGGILEHIDLRVDGRTIAMGGVPLGGGCRSITEPLSIDRTAFQGPDLNLIGVRRIEVLAVVVPCHDSRRVLRQVVRLSGAAYVHNLAGGVSVKLRGSGPHAGWQATVALRDRP